MQSVVKLGKLRNWGREIERANIGHADEDDELRVTIVLNFGQRRGLAFELGTSCHPFLTLGLNHHEMARRRTPMMSWVVGGPSRDQGVSDDEGIFL